MNIWAISDLHLGFSTGKWMDRFGDHWKSHHLRVEAAWKERVAEDDIVLLPGDFSWAMKSDEVAQEFEWLASLPGRKVLTKGNHDYWWPSSHKKLESLLPRGVYAIKKRALVLDGVPIIGVRGGDFWVREEGTLASSNAPLVRERHELLLSVGHLREIYSGDLPPIALFHYPPFRLGTCESVFTRILEDVGCKFCVFGHLHTEVEWKRVFQGEKNGVTYRLVSCDSLSFVPLLLVKEVA